MSLRVQMTKLVGSALLAAFAVHLLSADAMAAKETFQRNKPHVNVGTIGIDPKEPDQLTGNTDGSDDGGASSQALDSSANADCQRKATSGGQSSC